jgi:hypothetical protein
MLWDVFTYGFNATDPRDHVYGLLGLGNFGIIPDYTQDLASFLQDLVIAWMKDTSTMDWLHYGGIGVFD